MTDPVAIVCACLEEGFRWAQGHGTASEGQDPPEWARRLSAMLARALSARGESALAGLLAMGVRDFSQTIDRVALAVTGEAWLGGGVPAVERVLAEMLTSAEREILVTAYTMTPGSGRIWDELERAVVTGVRCRFVLNQLRDQPAETQALLGRLMREHAGNVEVYDFRSDQNTEGLHAKAVVVDRRVALIGSANLSFRGMVGAHEMAAILRGPSAALVAGSIDRLVLSSLVRKGERR